jgi:hypothetical protein
VEPPGALVERTTHTYLELASAVGAFALIALVSMQSLVEARLHQRESCAIRTLKSIATAEAVFREGDSEQDGNLDYGMLSELSNFRLVDCPHGAYVFHATYSFATSEFLWFAVANHEDGRRSFATNQTGVVFSTTAPYALDTSTCFLPPDGRIPQSK